MNYDPFAITKNAAKTKEPTDHRKIIVTATNIGQQYIQSIQQQ